MTLADSLPPHELAHVGVKELVFARYTRAVDTTESGPDPCRTMTTSQAYDGRCCICAADAIGTVAAKIASLWLFVANSFGHL